MGFIYLNKFTYLSTFVIQLAQRCSDNGGPAVTQCKVEVLITRYPMSTEDLSHISILLKPCMKEKCSIYGS